MEEIATVRLDTGHHEEGSGKGCLLEWVAIFAGVPYSDSPSCTSPVLGAFGRAFNDGLPDETRQRLVPFIPRLVGTAGDPAADEVRAWMATDWLIRTFTVAWLRKAGLTARADALAALPALSSSELARAAQPIIDGARKEAAAARDAAWDAAEDAARDATWAAARDAAWDAARDAARDAAKSKKGYAAQYGAAYKAARSVLNEAFRETTAGLTESAFDLFSRMIDVRSEVAA